jgi:hypothetical protein
MEYPVVISKCQHKTNCEIIAKHENKRAAVSVGAEGMSKEFAHLFCDYHMKQIVIEGIKYYNDDAEFIELVKAVLSLKGGEPEISYADLVKENEELRNQIKDLTVNETHTKIMQLKAVIESQESQIATLENRVKKAHKAGGKE